MNRSTALLLNIIARAFCANPFGFILSIGMLVTLFSTLWRLNT